MDAELFFVAVVEKWHWGLTELGDWRHALDRVARKQQLIEIRDHLHVVQGPVRRRSEEVCAVHHKPVANDNEGEAPPRKP